MKIGQVLTATIVLMTIAHSVFAAYPYVPDPEVCGENEEYNDCGSACEETCKSGPVEWCTLQCVYACFCKPGYIRETEHGRCIQRSQCPVYY